MTPIPSYAVERCSQQTQYLFDVFMELDGNYEDLLAKKRNSQEFHEVYHSGLQRDSARGLKSFNDPSTIVSRSPGNTHRFYSSDVEQKRRSIELAKRDSYGSTPPKDSYLQRDRGSPGMSSPAMSSPAVSSSQAKGLSAQLDERKEMTKEIKTKEYAAFPDEKRTRTYSTGPTDEQIREAALTIARVGDKIEQEYGSRLHSIEKDLTNFVRSAGVSLSYEVFAAHVNDLIGQDRNWTDFMFVMFLSKRVITTTRSVGTNTIEYFRRFVGNAFAEEVAERTDVVNFVRENSG